LEKVRYHGHLKQETFLFIGTPKGLGLAPEYSIQHDCYAKETSQLGFKVSNRFRDTILTRNQNKLVCSIIGTSVTVDGIEVARTPRIDCSDWSFDEQTTFTVLSIFGAMPEMIPRDVPPGWMQDYRQIHMFLDLFYVPTTSDGTLLSAERLSHSIEPIDDPACEERTLFSSLYDHSVRWMGIGHMSVAVGIVILAFVLMRHGSSGYMHMHM
jgi:hypothetical protein